MKIPSDISFESSYLLELKVLPDSVLISADLALRREHALYKPAPAEEAGCFRIAKITIDGFKELAWTNAGGAPGIEPDGTTSYNFDVFKSDGDKWLLEGDWGQIKGLGGSLKITFEES